MKKPKKWAIYALLTLCFTGMIFFFSLQPANTSAKLSGGLLKKLLDLWFQLTNLEIPLEAVHNLFRKLAHLGEFFLLGCFSYLWWKNLEKPWFFAWIYCGIVAVLDEGIQFFAGGGRAMRVTDMGIDGFGALLGILGVLSVSRLLRKKEKSSISKKM